MGDFVTLVLIQAVHILSVFFVQRDFTYLLRNLDFWWNFGIWVLKDEDVICNLHFD